MSLDVYLTLESANVKRNGSGIFIREGGQTKEITRDEWNARHPDREPVVVLADYDETDQVFSANITHNMNAMAEAAGIYKPLWRPDEIGIGKASQLIVPLRAGLAKLNSEPERFRAFNPSNGWGSYELLVSFVADYLAACERWPEADVRVWR